MAYTLEPISAIVKGSSEDGKCTLGEPTQSLFGQCKYCQQTFYACWLPKHESMCPCKINYPTKISTVQSSCSKTSAQSDSSGSVSQILSTDLTTFKLPKKSTSTPTILSRNESRKFPDWESGNMTSTSSFECGPTAQLPRSKLRQCPHCLRFFSRAGADRHFPVCERIALGKVKSRLKIGIKHSNVAGVY